MRTLESVKRGAPRPGVSPDVEATAEVLRALYLPSECRHLVALLREEEAAPEPVPHSRQAGKLASDAAFLDAVHALLSRDPAPPSLARAASELRDTFQIRVRFLDALQDEMRRARAAGQAPRLPGREELAQLLDQERDRYGPNDQRAVSPAIRHQLRAA